MHRLAALITIQLILFLHYIYPRARALLRALMAIGRKHRVRERLINHICLFLGWFWRVAMLGALGWIVADGKRDDSEEIRVKKSPREGAKKENNREAAKVKGWLSVCVA